MVKINMMCGKRQFGDDWYNVDGNGLPHIHSNDLHLRLLPTGCVDLMVCSHGISYFDSVSALSLLDSWFRVLRPGGTLRIATPDLYKIGWMLSNGLCTVPEVTGPIYGYMQMNGQAIQHKTGYDFVTLAQLLTDAGFTDVRLYDHRATEHPNTGNREDRFDDCSAAYLNGELISLNVQATKP